MRHALRKFNQDEATRGVRPLQTGLALHWGHVVLGTIGTQQRLDTTVIGDPVNVAARLEGLSRHFGSEILITGEFVAALSTPNNHQMRLVARSVLRGRHADTTVYEVLDSLEPAQLKLRLSSRHLLEEGIGALEDERFVDATRCFLAGHEIDKDDATFAYYLDTAERERRLTTMPSGLTI